MSDIFISYAREDLEHARRLRESLSAKGWSVFWDRRIPPGRSFEEIIEEQIRDCRAMVVIWSRNSATSKWVKIEAAIGRDRDILVPVLVEQAEIPFGYGHLQAADLTKWREAATPEFDDLVASIERLAPRRVYSPTSDAPPPPVHEPRPVTPPSDTNGGKKIKGAASPVRMGSSRSAVEPENVPSTLSKARSLSHQSVITPLTVSGDMSASRPNKHLRLILAIAGGFVAVAMGAYYFTRPDTSARSANVPKRQARENAGEFQKRPTDVLNVVQSPAQMAEKTPEKKEPKGAIARQPGSASRIRHTPQAMDGAQVMAELKASDRFDNRWNARGHSDNSFEKCLVGSTDLIYDAASALLWARPIEREFSVTEANAEIRRRNAQRYGERSDWRLPTLDELSTLLEARTMDGEPCMRPAGASDSPDSHRTCINPVFGLKKVNPQQPFFWTSDPAQLQGGDGTNWGVAFTSSVPQHWGKWATAGVFPVAVETARPAGCSPAR